MKPVIPSVHLAWHVFSLEYTLALRYETLENWDRGQRYQDKASLGSKEGKRLKEIHLFKMLVEWKNIFKLQIFASSPCTWITSLKKKPSTLTTHPTFTEVQKSIHYRSYQRLWSFPGKSGDHAQLQLLQLLQLPAVTGYIKNMPSSHVIST